MANFVYNGKTYDIGELAESLVSPVIIGMTAAGASQKAIQNTVNSMSKNLAKSDKDVRDEKFTKLSEDINQDPTVSAFCASVRSAFEDMAYSLPGHGTLKFERRAFASKMADAYTNDKPLAVDYVENGPEDCELEKWWDEGWQFKVSREIPADVVSTMDAATTAATRLIKEVHGITDYKMGFDENWNILVKAPGPLGKGGSTTGAVKSQTGKVAMVVDYKYVKDEDGRLVKEPVLGEPFSGKSREVRDWVFMQLPHATKPKFDKATGRFPAVVWKTETADKFGYVVVEH